MVDVVLQGAWVLYRLNKNEGDEPLPLLDFRRDVNGNFFLNIQKKAGYPRAM